MAQLNSSKRSHIIDNKWSLSQEKSTVSSSDEPPHTATGDIIKLSCALASQHCEEHIKEQLRHRVKQDLEIELEDVDVRTVHCGTVDFEIHIVPRTKHGAKSQPNSTASHMYSSLARILESMEFRCKPAKVVINRIFQSSSQSHDIPCAKVRPESNGMDGSVTPSSSNFASKEAFTSPGGTLHRIVCRRVQKENTAIV